jgi:lysozyme
MFLPFASRTSLQQPARGGKFRRRVAATLPMGYDSPACPMERNPVPRTINDAGLDLIKHFEGCRLTAYQDVAGIWTIGYGHTAGVSEGLVFTQAQADQALLDDLTDAEAAVDSAVQDVATTDNQFAAMVSLCYNIGAGNFADSTVLREHRAGRTQQAADAFLLWNKATIDGVLQVVTGLTNRREAERTLYLT